jgi:2,3-bisphosphoglycerate-independent phosphoglycerate mutase
VKYAVLVADGMADYPLDELEGRTPLEVAKTPNMDFIAREGVVGQANMIPRGFEAGSDVANLSIFGYDPRKHYSGRGPLEAANMGVKLKKDEVAFRCNLVTVSDSLLTDYSAGHISTKEARILIEFLNKRLANKYIKFYPGISYRHLMVIKPTKKGLEFGAKCKPPHNITGKQFSRNLPKGPGAVVLKDLMMMSKNILSAHEINQVRVDLGENPANMIWLWGQGKKAEIPSFYSKYKIRGSVISAVDLIKGIGKSIGLEVIEVPGATGYYDTDYKAKAEYGLRSLKEKDFVFIHVEAPDEAGHNGDIRAKINSIENFDREIVARFVEFFEQIGDLRILVLPDHPTPIKIKTHTSDAVCFCLCGKGILPDKKQSFSEFTAKKSSYVFKDGYKLMDEFIRGKEEITDV